jgi:hypothetical protein
MKMMKSRGYQNKQKQEWKKRLLFKIAKEELVEGVKEVLEIKTINSNDRIYKIAVRVKDTEGEYIVYAIIQLISPASNDGYPWKLIDLWWEEKT